MFGDIGSPHVILSQKKQYHFMLCEMVLLFFII